jgi:hypothetical protein
MTYVEAMDWYYEDFIEGMKEHMKGEMKDHSDAGKMAIEIDPESPEIKAMFEDHK